MCSCFYVHACCVLEIFCSCKQRDVVICATYLWTSNWNWLFFGSWWLFSRQQYIPQHPDLHSMMITKDGWKADVNFNVEVSVWERMLDRRIDANVYEKSRTISQCGFLLKFCSSLHADLPAWSTCGTFSFVLSDGCTSCHRRYAPKQSRVKIFYFVRSNCESLGALLVAIRGSVISQVL